MNIFYFFHRYKKLEGERNRVFIHQNSIRFDIAFLYLIALYIVYNYFYFI